MENVKSVKQAEAPSSGRPPHRHNKALGSLKYAKQVRSQRDGAALGGIAALRRRGKHSQDVRRRCALHYPQSRFYRDIRYRIYEFEY